MRSFKDSIVGMDSIVGLCRYGTVEKRLVLETLKKALLIKIALIGSKLPPTGQN